MAGLGPGPPLRTEEAHFGGAVSPARGGPTAAGEVGPGGPDPCGSARPAPLGGSAWGRASRWARQSLAARGYGEELQSSSRLREPYCCINLSARAAASSAGIIYFPLQVLFNFDPIAAVRALASPLPPEQPPPRLLP